MASRFCCLSVIVLVLQDIQNRIIKSTSKLLAEILFTSWRNEPLTLQITEQQLKGLSLLLQNSGAGGLAWWRIHHLPLKDSPVALEFQQLFRLQTLQVAKQENEIKQLFAYMREAGVEPVLVKGWAINRLYPAKGLRPCGDIDLFIDPRQYAKAREVRFGQKAAKYAIDIQCPFKTIALPGVGGSTVHWSPSARLSSCWRRCYRPTRVTQRPAWPEAISKSIATPTSR